MDYYAIVRYTEGKSIEVVFDFKNSYDRMLDIWENRIKYSDSSLAGSPLLDYYSAFTRHVGGGPRDPEYTFEEWLLDHTKYRLDVAVSSDLGQTWKTIDPDQHIWIPEQVYEDAQTASSLLWAKQYRLPVIDDDQDFLHFHLSISVFDKAETNLLTIDLDTPEKEVLSLLNTYIVQHQRYTKESKNIICAQPVDVFYPTLATEYNTHSRYRPITVAKFSDGWAYKGVHDAKFIYASLYGSQLTDFDTLVQRLVRVSNYSLEDWRQWQESQRHSKVDQ